MRTNVFLIVYITLLLAFNAFPQVNVETFRKDADSIGISAEIAANLSLRYGNINIQEIQTKNRINYNFGLSYSFLVIQGDYGWKDKKQYSNQALIHLRYVGYLTKILQAEFFGQYNYNKAILLSSRNLYGSGIRIKILTYDEILKVRYGISFFYEIETYDMPIYFRHPRKTNGMKLSNYLTAFFNPNDYFSLSTIAYYQPLMKNFSDYRILSETTVYSKISKNVYFTFTFNLAYDSRPPDNKKKYDLRSLTGIIVKL